MRHFFALLVTFASISRIFAQTGCPGCVVSLPPGLPADTIYTSPLPDGIEGVYYNHDLAFRIPKTTTPVAAVDSTTPPGYTINQIDILSIDGLPPGMSWQPNQFSFNPANQTDGCIKFCGTPTIADSFLIAVKLKVTVFVVTKEAYLYLHMYIAPKISSTAGFSMNNFIGCGSDTVSFTNNIPSNGNPGFNYAWEFGDGSPVFMGENPPAHIYNTPGQYTVQYHAKIDTAGYILLSATVLSVDCSDPLGFGGPDLYMQLFNPSGVKKYDSSPSINNTVLPHTFTINQHIGSGNYNLQVFDEDSGIKGGDDPCGNISFNILSNDTIVSGGFTVVLNILHPVVTINSKDTVTVFANPPKPLILAPNGLTKCTGESNPIILTTAAPVLRTWFRNGQAIANAVDSALTATQSGYYKVQTTTADGCTAVSDSVHVQVFPLPAIPTYTNSNNLLHVANPSALPASYSLQWYNGGTLIPGATGLKYCATASGTYGLLVTDLVTHCTRFYAANVLFDPNFDCTIATQSPEVSALRLYPNPAREEVTVELGTEIGAGAQLVVWDASGKLIVENNLPAGASAWVLECGKWNPGVYLVKLRATDGRYRTGKLVIVP
jgi:hypothetical protein